MPEPALAMPASRINPTAFLWLLVAIGLVTMNAPADISATLHHLRVPDPDDAMRLVEVRDLVDGQGWYDLVQRRFGPPVGIPSHWSRLVDAPLAGLILTLTPLTGRPLAEGAAALLWPGLLFCLYAVVLFRGVRATFGARSALIALVVATQTLGVTIQFAAGRVDHHDIQLIAILGLAFAMIGGGARGGAVAGALGALSLAVGLEGLPFLAAAALFLAADWILRGRPALAAFTAFGAALGLCAPVLFGAQVSPALWGRTACDALSPPWLFLAGGGLAIGLSCMALDRHLQRRTSRFLALTGLGTLLLGGFALLFPVCLGGPFPGMTALVRDHWLLKVNEMTDAATFVARGQWEALAFYPVVLLATLVATRLAFRGPHRRFWAVASALLWPGLVLGLEEFRGLYVVSGLVPLVAGPFIGEALRRASMRSLPSVGRIALAAGLVSTVWIAPIALGETLFPAARTANDPAGATACLGDGALAPLAALPPGTVLAPIFMGPAILLHTPHAVVAAPYHRAVPEIAAALRGLGGTEGDLRRETRTHGVRYLATCAGRPADDLQAETAFATRLTRGEAKAGWLKPLTDAGPVKVWQVAP
ncbi:hypothetical protein [Methylobacterium aerolatum]|uniref:Glycosyltransferase RgtA/B/C/D-like domain-containing protein n=1 Tax=Methylobacterium aerolatum TaxID=418708 RepID=A0ABU0HZ62_9HYPH|nr:hypothetical protein [Methylobacterium aerolatum]MDQ0447638.1 hypothetical protein [Methylobacterium aerolatum]GJD34738.1 hypothetical protein FMGBMHLM_1641 [Methylobacterium aerolatum]